MVWVLSQCHLYICDSLRPSCNPSSLIFSLDQMGFLSNSASKATDCSLFFLKEDWAISSRVICSSLMLSPVFFNLDNLLRFFPA